MLVQSDVLQRSIQMQHWYKELTCLFLVISQLMTELNCLGVSHVKDLGCQAHCRGEGANAALHHCSDSTETFSFKSALAPGNNCSGYCCKLHQHIKHVFSTRTQELHPEKEPSKAIDPIKEFYETSGSLQAPEQFLNTLEGQRDHNHLHRRADTRS